MVKVAEDISLTINSSKCEISIQNHTILGTILTSLFGVHSVDPINATLLVSPFGNGKYISKANTEKTIVLKWVREMFVALSARDTFVFLRHSFFIPKLQYFLHTALFYQSKALVEYHNTLAVVHHK